MNISFKYIRILGLLLMLGGFSACNDDESDIPETGPANRTVLVYMMAENSLSNFAEQGSGNLDSDIEEMVLGASSIPDNDHLIVFLDDANTSHNPRIYEIKKATGKMKARVELVKEYPAELCSTDPAVLEEVLDYVKTNFPAKGYGLVMWSHGGGWLPAAKVKDSRSIGIDNEENSASNIGFEMEISALAEVLADFGKLDFLYFDACYMQGIEVAYELKEVTDYVIGCPAETPAIGARYDRIILPMFASTVDVEGIVLKNYQYYLSFYEVGNKSHPENYGCLLSAIRCNELDALAALTAPIIEREASDKHLLPIGSDIQTYRGTSSWPEFYDFCGAIYSLSNTNDEYAQWLIQFNKAVVCRVHTDEWFGGGSWAKWLEVKDEHVSPYGGVSMYVPYDSPSHAKWNKAFQNTQWYQAVWKNTGW